MIPKGDYSDNLRRLQLKMKIPGSEWDTGALQRTQCLDEQPRGAPNLTGPAEIRAAAEAAALEFEAERQEIEADAQELGIPVDPIGVDAFIVDLHRRCLGGPYKEGTVRSQRDFFGVLLDRPAGVPELMAGPKKSSSVSRRREQSISAEAQQMLVTPATEHLIYSV